MRETIASRAILIFWKDPIMWIFLEEDDDQCMMKRQKDIGSRVCEDNTCPARILNGELCFAVLACDTTNSSREMITLESLDILDLK